MSLNNQTPPVGKINKSPRVKVVGTVNPARSGLVKQSNKGGIAGNTDGQSLGKVKILNLKR